MPADSRTSRTCSTDFATCARWLAASGWTRAGRIAVSGRSNGGLLVGAAMTQRPGLFGAALPAVGVMDMLRFHKFTIGRGWTSTTTAARRIPRSSRPILKYSPLHNLKPGTRVPAHARHHGRP